MADTQTFDPVRAGFRVATGPIARKPRRPSSRPQPKPQYADSVWWSFNNDQPLEVAVPVRSVEDTVRKLKRAARYLERTKSTDSKKVEVRVQIGVEPELDDKGQPTKKSVVKFLGHRPWALGRRVAKMEADAREAGQDAGEQAAADVLARQVPPQARHRRTTAGTRATTGRHTKASLRDALVWAVITPRQP